MRDFSNFLDFQPRAGEVISRVINDVEQTKNFVVIGLMNVWLDLATILIAIGIMLTLNVKLTLVTLIAFPFYAFSVKYFFGRLRDLTRQRSQALAGVQSYLHERVQGMKSGMANFMIPMKIVMAICQLYGFTNCI